MHESTPVIGQSPGEGWEVRWVLGFEGDKRLELHPDNIECVWAKMEEHPWWLMRRPGSSHSVSVLASYLYPSRYEALLGLKSKLVGRISVYEAAYKEVGAEIARCRTEQTHES